jgi:Concanavalin A-like lectin/glucanases superfamily/Calcineurin-like phosphoesterase
MRLLHLAHRTARKGTIFFLILTLVMLLIVPAISFDGKEATAIIFSSTYLMPKQNFVVVGGWDCNDNAVKTVKGIQEKSPELVLSLGDIQQGKKNTTNTVNTSATPLECWLQMVDPIDEKMKIAIGDEDVKPRLLLQQYMSHFNITRQYYSFDYQNIHFLVMGTEVPYDTASKQYNFANKDLSKAASNPNTDWIIVALHKPLYSSPSNLIKEYQAPLSVTYHPLFDKYGVDLVIQGHEHGYERSDPIKYNPSSYSKPIISDSHTNNYVNPDGPIFVTVGTAGATLHEFEGKRPFIATQYSGFGFLNVDVTTTNNAKIMNVQFYANDEDSAKDLFSITKSDMNTIDDNASGMTTSLSASSFYRYEPYLTLFGNNHFDMTNSSALQLTNFSIAAWFSTIIELNSIAFIVNKGGSGNDTEGMNMNYGLYMTPTGHIGSTFENRNGTKFSLNSPSRYNDNQWHYAVATFDGSEMRLYVDGILNSFRHIPSRNASDNIIPDNTGIQPVRVGSNSLNSSKNYFTGHIDEVRIWGLPLTSQQVYDAHRKGVFNTTGQVAYLSFNGSKAPN